MNSRILNRNFQHPDDGWYQIEAKGTHPNRRAGIVQVIDDDACESIVNRFNDEAAKPNFAGMLVDHEHFKHDETKETRAYGWLMKLTNRQDGIYGKIRWSDTGRRSVDGGDYRFFSTEYDPGDLAVLNREGSPKRVRPLRLDGLTLTNANNNKGQKPITNRMKNKDNDSPSEDEDKSADALAASKKANDASNKADSAPQHEKAAVLHRKAQKLCADCGKDDTAEYHGDMADHHDTIADTMRKGVNNREFPTAPGSAERQRNTNQETMKTVLKALGLAEDASEAAALTATTKLTNRVKELEESQIDGDLEVYKNRFKPEQRETIRSLLVTNRAATVEHLKSLPEIKTPPSPARIHNRETAKPADANPALGAPEDAELSFQRTEAIENYKVTNRCSHAKAHDAVRRLKPELFGLPKRN